MTDNIAQNLCDAESLKVARLQSEFFTKCLFELRIFLQRMLQYHPDAKGVRQKEFGKKVTKKVTEASEKVTEK